jgi:hypothetical protein
VVAQFILMLFDLVCIGIDSTINENLLLMYPFTRHLNKIWIIFFDLHQQNYIEIAVTKRT